MKIIIADDHDLVRDALALLVTHGTAENSVLQASDFDGALEAARLNADVDLVLLDVHMPGMKNMSAIEELNQLFPDLPVVLMSGQFNQRDVSRAFELGARGFIPKTLNGKALVCVLEMVINGVPYVPDIMLDSSAEDPSRMFDLSPRELEVLGQLFKGLSNKVIAAKLDIEESTVKLHLRTLFKKLGVNNRTEAVIVARDSGLHLA
jgi:DNA-binding NarL/FixJ family response regulator